MWRQRLRIGQVIQERMVLPSSGRELGFENGVGLPDGGPRRSLDVFGDVHDSESVVGRLFYPHSVSVTTRAEKFKGLVKAVEFGPFAMAELDYNVGIVMDVPSIAGYHLNMSLEAGLTSATELGKVQSAPGAAALYRVGSRANLQTISDSTFRIFALKIDSAALERTMSGLIGSGADRERIQFAGDLDLSQGDGLRWWNLVSSVRDQWTDNTLLNNPMVSTPLFQAVLAGLLLVARHQHFERLHEKPSIVAVPETVRMAEDFILEKLAEPLTVVEIARFVNVSTRSLQRAFSEHRDMTPMQYVRLKRLERVHADLLASDPAQVRVADVAARWGFVQLGRFACEYRKVYGSSPKQALYG